MRALTLQQPMGWAIVTPHSKAKRIENRPRDLPKAMKAVETVVAVHSGKTWRDDYADMIARIFGVTEIRHFTEPGLIGLMRLTGRVFKHAEAAMRPEHADGFACAPWYIGPFGYEIKDAIMFESGTTTPAIPCRGKLGFWPLSPELEAKVVMQPGVLEGGWWDPAAK